LALVLLAVAARGHRISTREVLLHAPWQIVIFSLGMYLVVYGLRNAGLTAYLTAALDWCAQYGVWSAAMGTGFLTAILSSIMNNLPTVLVGALSVDHHARRSARSDDLCERDRQRPRSEDHADRQPGDAALAARAGQQRHAYLVGLLLPRGDCSDLAGIVCHVGGARRKDLKWIRISSQWSWKNRIAC
jgi:hypothetical protein